MVRFQHLLAACFVVMLCSSNSMAQDFNPQLPRLLKWLLFWCKKLPKNPELYKSTTEIIALREYEYETHYVVTSDKYILTLHRMPSKSGNGRPVYLQHGAFQSSKEWVANPSERSLAFQLSDLGFDVWLGNARGNVYSKSHFTLDNYFPEFWNFAWDEVGDYDIPAMMEYILERTSQPKLIYISYGLGAAYFFIAMNNHPELNDKVETMFALAPVASSNYFTKILPLISRNIKSIEFLLDLISPKAVFYQPEIISRIKNKFCAKKYYQAEICRFFIMFSVGFNPKNLPLDQVPVLLSTMYEGTSLNTMLQFFQNYDKGLVLNAFDYGPEENMNRYGTETPKTYDLKKVTVPVHIFWSMNDFVANLDDVEWISNSLGNLQSSNRVPNLKFNHIDFIFGNDVAEKVYRPLLSLLPPAVI